MQTTPNKEEGRLREKDRQPLEEGKQSLEEGKQSLEEGKQSLEEGKQSLEEGRLVQVRGKYLRQPQNFQNRPAVVEQDRQLTGFGIQSPAV